MRVGRSDGGASLATTAPDLGDLTAEMDFIRFALDSAAIVAITDVQGTITFVNAKFCEISGYARDELIGANHRILRSDMHDRAFFRSMFRRIASGQVWHGEICNRRKDGSHYWVDTTIVPHVNGAGKVDSYTAIRFDITPRREVEEQLRYAVSVDLLTGIPNRRRFQEYLAETLAPPSPNGKTVHLGLLDIDVFKEVNDLFGHDMGDELLREVGKRLGAFAGEDSFVARMGGDEFGIVLTGRSEAEAVAFMERVLEDMRVPVRFGSASRKCSASIGIATYPADAQTPDDLFKAADMALYRAKALGRDRTKLFQNSMRDAAESKADLVATIESGLAANQFCLHYQPIVPLDSEGGFSLEALLRWNHPQRGLLSPGAFLLNVDDPGLQADISMFVLEQLFADLRVMMSRHLPIRRVALNVTNADFRSDAFVERCLALIAENGVEPARFCIEVTEGVLLGRDFPNVEMRLKRLQEAGVEIALDDFGTGFASLTHLHMPVDRIKIDRGFVANILTSSLDLAIVRGIIDIAHAMGKTVTAEGVETREQAELLRDLGCDLLQGWYFAKACSLERLPWVLANLTRLPVAATRGPKMASSRN